MPENPIVTVRDNPVESRFEVLVDGQVVGLAAYSRRGTVISFVHTEVTPELSGLGLATTLVRSALASARARGLDVLPYCQFVSHYIATHPDELDLVPAIRRAAFGLSTRQPAPV
ncbi:MAG: N-acetyltransferase [Bifidobacteriaceae bacterium]|jgi:predicted GNAT family acetyltransferase|nr:N-acetyltransferase [Bifidobacteriaceae bacterium]